MAKRDIQQEQTEMLATMLESVDPNNFILPWHECVNQGTPTNALTKRQYTNGNAMMLWVYQMLEGYETNQWATYKQWFELGGGKTEGKGKNKKIIQPSKYNVRAGEKGSFISVPIPCAFDQEMDNVKTGETETVHISFTRFKASSVFNASQIDGYEIERPERPNLVDSIEKAEQFFSNLGIEKREAPGRAFYQPTGDFYSLPPMSDFIDTPTSTATECYYSTEAHETGHATGHVSRLDRYSSRDFTNKKERAFEELIAECTACFVCAHLGISTSPREDHAQYLAGWLRLLKSDKTAFQRAASKAGDALNWMIEQQPKSLSKAA